MQTFFANPVAVLLHWAVSALALMVTSFLVPGFKVRGFKGALVSSFFIAVAFYLLGPLLIFLTLPFNILTLGLFTFVVNAIILRICAAVLRDFEIKSWMAAILGALILALVGSALHFFLV